MGTHPIFESDFDCLTGIGSIEKRNHLESSRRNNQISMSDEEPEQIRKLFIGGVKDTLLNRPSRTTSPLMGKWRVSKCWSTSRRARNVALALSTSTTMMSSTRLYRQDVT